MRKRNVWGTCLAVVVFTCGVGAQQPSTASKTVEDKSPPAANATGLEATPQAASAQKVVLKVGSAQVTESEIDTLISKLDPKAKAIVEKQGRQPVGDEYVRTLLLSQRALAEHLDSSPDVRAQLELQRAQTLAQAEYQKMASKVQITQEEVSQYFTAHRSEFETVQVRQFLIRKGSESTGDASPGMTTKEAKDTADSIRRALLAGKDVDEVGQDFGASISRNVMLIDRKPRTLHRDEMKPALQKATFNLPDGGVSEVVDTPQAFMVVKVLAHQRPELKDVEAEIQAKLQRQKLDAEIDAMKRKTGVWMDEDYFKGPVAAASASTTQPSSTKPHSEP